ncbi:hypothetical protein RclHR1_02830008 [Rhizophagus clarus]|uniref:Uncharacterized protein n=1 Tax=Rhizophagus clarus TaxID=94130 RepID=A0A2Z6R7B6_9GLOM|nr:hypothetical protein RclHR1_02830008 [Rhizophagus clarus]
MIDVYLRQTIIVSECALYEIFLSHQDHSQRHKEKDNIIKNFLFRKQKFPNSTVVDQEHGYYQCLTSFFLFARINKGQCHIPEQTDYKVPQYRLWINLCGLFEPKGFLDTPVNLVN